MDISDFRRMDMANKGPRARLKNMGLPDCNSTASLMARIKEANRIWPGREWYCSQSYFNLNQFCLNRKIALFPPGCVPSSRRDTPSKNELVNALTAQDKAMRFKFMELPAEIRNQVYSHLLIDPRQNVNTVEKLRPRCQTTILAVSKAINKEATPMLYANNHISLNLKFEPVTTAGIEQDQFSIDCINHYGGDYCDDFSARSVLHKPNITKVRCVNIHIIIAGRYVLEERATTIKQTVAELKNYMAAHTGREQTLRITFDLDFNASPTSLGSGSEQYKKINRLFIAEEAIAIMKPFTEFVEAKQYAHLPGCQTTKVEFFVGCGINFEVVATLSGIQQSIEAEVAKEHKRRDYLLQTVEQLVHRDAMGRGTEKIIKKSWREDRWGVEDDKAYLFSLKTNSQDIGIPDDDDEMGKDDDSVTFESDDEQHEEDDADFEEDLQVDDGDFNLEDFIEKPNSDDRIDFSKDIMEDKEVEKWIENGGFGVGGKNEIDRVRQARLERFGC
jgi:hypothetical protein